MLTTRKSVILPLIAAALLVSSPLALAKKGGKLDIEVKEWNVSVSEEFIAAGDIDVKVKNTGKETHELVFIKLDTDLATGRLPVDRDGGIDEKKMNFGTIVQEFEGLEPGKKVKETVNLKPGRYAILCNMVEQEDDGSMEAHYSMGMHTVLNVE